MAPQPKDPTRRKAQGSRGTPCVRGPRELNRLIDLLNDRGEVLNRVLRDQEIPFQRIAHIQADLDLIKGMWSRTKS